MDCNYTNVQNGILVFDGGGVVITDANSALDLAVNAEACTGATKFVINKDMLCPAFFDLKTGLAGEILQKFTNYGFKMAVFGDFSQYSSKALKDFMFEANNGRGFCFVPTVEQAVERMKNV